MDVLHNENPVGNDLVFRGGRENDPYMKYSYTITTPLYDSYYPIEYQTSY